VLLSDIKRWFLLSCAYVVAAGTMGAAISPTPLEVNLAMVPIDIYTSPQTVDLFPGASCHTVGGVTPQTCIRQFLSAYRGQGVTGVRFFFALGGGQWSNIFSGPGPNPLYPSYSTPFVSGGGLSTSWAANLSAFLQISRRRAFQESHQLL